MFHEILLVVILPPMNETKKVWIIAKAANFVNRDASTTDVDTGPSRIEKNCSITGSKELTIINISGANCCNIGSSIGTASIILATNGTDFNCETWDMVDMNDIGMVQKIHKTVVPIILKSLPTWTSL